MTHIYHKRVGSLPKEKKLQPLTMRPHDVGNKNAHSLHWWGQKGREFSKAHFHWDGRPSTIWNHIRFTFVQLVLFQCAFQQYRCTWAWTRMNASPNWYYCNYCITYQPALLQFDNITTIRQYYKLIVILKTLPVSLY